MSENMESIIKGLPYLMKVIWPISLAILFISWTLSIIYIFWLWKIYAQMVKDSNLNISNINDIYYCKNYSYSMFLLINSHLQKDK